MLTNGISMRWAKQIIATNPMFRPGDRMLAAMPLFHGFGLGVCVHSMLARADGASSSPVHRQELCQADREV